MSTEGTANKVEQQSATIEADNPQAAAQSSAPITPDLCANCSTPLQGGFCHACGQENTNPIRNMLSLVHEFFGEMGNWDGRFWRTIWPLLTKPGFLSNQYVRGKRVPYVPPLRMYLFVSIFAFVVFSQASGKLNFLQGSPLTATTDVELSAQDRADLRDTNARFREQFGRDLVNPDLLLEPEGDAASSAEATDAADGEAVLAPPRPPRTGNDLDRLARGEESFSVGFLSAEQNAELTEKVRFLAQRPKLLVDRFLSIAPQMMLIMLPIFALVLKLFYAFSRRYYIEHVVVALHTHAFLLLMTSLIIGVSALKAVFAHLGLAAGGLGWMVTVMLWWMPIYLLLTQKRFYRQSWLPTVFKFLFIGFLYTLIITSTIIIGLIWSVWRS
ncbi:MAG: DUF3667 domain-containing protein [Aliidiomarina sp.]|uniref:DUF3667 domain-containing protein n=1 Tax=Aliidiomarina sp. TaxID=1872439 RepID=UPI0025BF0185|nr:DUF3667 domain-containing protein [Aliidiomarina sp.]MCH8501717.1 DUF3667 domain-containing protein [Aliidiomarina sp.]